MPNIIREYPKARITNIEVLQGGVLYVHAQLTYLDSATGFHQQYNPNDYGSLNQLASQVVADIKAEWEKNNSLLQITRDYYNYSIDW